jgi:Zn-dependent protease with chaperone function
MSMINFSQIHPRAFAHPADIGATSAFAQIPMVPELLKKVSQLGVEERVRAHHMYNSVQLGPRQFPSIWRLVNDVAKRLGIPVPKVYVSRQGEANAFAFGKQTHSIVLTSELIDLMSERELQGIIAHEMGHILCEHMLYMDVGLALTSGTLPALTRFLPGLEESINGLFFAWFRAAEYSADRAALLILEDPEPLAACLSRLAGVPRRLEEEFDLRLFAEQVKDYREEATLWSKIVTLGMGAFLTHPEPAKRVGALLDWAESGEYRAILKGRYLTRYEAEALDRVRIEGVRSCPSCGRPVGQAPVCECGLIQDSRQQQLCPLNPNHVNGIDWKFCVACGAELKSDAGRSENLGC